MGILLRVKVPLDPPEAPWEPLEEDSMSLKVLS